MQGDDVAPDESIKPADEIIPAPERAAGFMSAPLMYSAVETALRTALGETVPENARATAELWAGFSRTAAANPDAWRREPVPPEFLEHPSAKNPMLAAPYTKWHCSQWNVDQAAGFVLCSTEAADRAGVPQDRRVYPLAIAESNHMLAVSKRAELHRAPAVRIGAERIAELTGHRRHHQRHRRPLQLLPGRGAHPGRVSSGCRSTIPTAARSASAAA